MSVHTVILILAFKTLFHELQCSSLSNEKKIFQNYYNRNDNRTVSLTLYASIVFFTPLLSPAIVILDCLKSQSTFHNLTLILNFYTCARTRPLKLFHV